MKTLYWLDQVQASDRPDVGDQAFYLSQFLRQDCPVLPGLVIPGSRLREFLHVIHWLEPWFADLGNTLLSLDVANFRQLQHIAHQIRHDVIRSASPDAWMSELEQALQPWAAPALMLRPSLYIQESNLTGLSQQVVSLLDAQICVCHRAALGTALKHLWADLFRARSLVYYKLAGLELPRIHLAVLVQPALPAIASGLMQLQGVDLEIQSIWGMGIALLRGEVVPYVEHVHLDSNHVSVHRAGQQNHAYGICADENVGAMAIPIEPTGELRPTFFAADQLQSPLREADRHTLLHLAQHLVTQFNRFGVLEWTVGWSSSHPTPQLYLTQAKPLPRVLGELTRSDKAVLPVPIPATALVAGLPAAPGRKTGTVLVLDRPQEQSIPAGTILVAAEVMPDWMPLLQQVIGIVTERGGLTSHAAIVARELGIPAVVGANGATTQLRSGDSVLIDGDRGQVYALDSLGIDPPDPVTVEAATPQTWLPIGTRLMVNLSQVNGLDQIGGLPIDGLGLLRSELMMMDLLSGQHPQQWIRQGRQTELVEQLAERLSQFCRAFAPRPVFYRSLDLRSHEFQQSLEDASPVVETNPMLGLRGTFSYIVDPSLFRLELAAIQKLHQMGVTNIRLLLPFVRTAEEFTFCRQLVIQAGLMQTYQFQLWIMAEVPSVLFLLPDYVRLGVQGISIGTNDLTQLLLGVDRDQERLANAFDERHPAVLSAITQLARQANELGIPCSICGQAPVRHPEMIRALIQAGVSSISVELGSLESTYQEIVRAERQILLEACRSGQYNN